MKKVQRILAILVIVIIVALYLTAFIASFFAKPQAGTLFNIAITGTVFFPLLVYVYMWTGKWLKGRGVDKEKDE